MFPESGDSGEKNGGPAVGGDDRHRLGIRIGRGGTDPKGGQVASLIQSFYSGPP
jgi:hypothetical protein